jgi:hypothetical protein
VRAVSGLVATARIGLARQRGSLPRSWPVSVRHQPVAAGAGLTARVWSCHAVSAETMRRPLINVNGESKCFSASICTDLAELGGQTAQKANMMTVCPSLYDPEGVWLWRLTLSLNPSLAPIWEVRIQ